MCLTRTLRAVFTPWRPGKPARKGEGSGYLSLVPTRRGPLPEGTVFLNLPVYGVRGQTEPPPTWEGD